jgi:hypothetical protein
MRPYALAAFSRSGGVVPASPINKKIAQSMDKSHAG